MKLLHVGLTCPSLEAAERFFGEALGLPKTRSGELTAPLAQRLFGLEHGCPMVYFGEGDVLFEVFITGRRDPSPGGLGHACIEVRDRGALLERCERLGVPARRAPKGDRELVFIEDPAGQLFEVKETR